ncbi:hypothetical protein UFOVP569_47 [uncultured Caudovirales phage]|uniref:Uncharacterized protein n=1 Tax=uncultured Caudovirales phage TaxID=2100421 RepID=A0A6J5QG39_9CAUD|nr:hypothetical protein UFOVP569_47 [uncultured Caudovirales phage]CAB4182522.1 hypothetical protein UFOVP1093_4 [uncultured Caudovirales phage]CAB4199621.1 hypothetical protein UFOVP1340_3 [uncultured Caudovirales phage]CAB4213446.1 hypothetical protein UFOVP1448_20 [uncultured Caudovirales phage]CAB4218922.1 hypothetical protein UFOVP1600_46 [uncultured Caudovirales phage]
MDKPQVELNYTQEGEWMLTHWEKYRPFRHGTVPAGHIHQFVITMMETMTPIAWVVLKPIEKSDYLDRLR